VELSTNQEWNNFEEVLNTPQKPTPVLEELMNLKGFEKN